MSRHSIAVRIGADAPAAVRDALRERLGHLPDRVRDDLALLLTEVVTNAVRHSGADDGTPVSIELNERRDHVRAEVVDLGDGFERPARPVPDLTKTGGLGLVLVDRMSRAWGTRRTERGSLVWFELAHDRGGRRADTGPD